LDIKAFYDLSYGVYVITAIDSDGKKCGCIANCAIQVTADPEQILVSVNHDNCTNKAILGSKRFALMVLAEDCDPSVIGTFGFKHSSETDKFADIPYEMKDGLPILKDAICYFTAEVTDLHETATHTLFIAEVKDAEMLAKGKTPMTYAYYHQVKKGLSPKNAPTYQDPAKKEAQGMSENNEKVMHHFKCLLCGYVYETEDEQLPADFVCPVCGAPADQFEKID
jgi:flavin reductase (DIM6/NTAB) family NADH-FMN oxidoreductase RutF/rubredoxin